MEKFPKEKLRSHIISMLTKVNAPYNKITVKKDPTIDYFINLQWDTHNNLKITYSDLIEHIDEEFLEELLEKEVEHYLEHLNRIKQS